MAVQVNAEIGFLGYSHDNSGWSVNATLSVPASADPNDYLVETRMYYAIISEDIEDSLPLRAQARPAHIDRLNRLKDKGRLLVAGPHPALDTPEPGNAGFTGSLVVAEFDSLEAAQAWADADPYVAAGVYRQVTVKPFKAVLP